MQLHKCFLKVAKIATKDNKKLREHLCPTEKTNTRLHNLSGLNTQVTQPTNVTLLNLKVSEVLNNNKTKTIMN
jgi:hypothetical protein